MFSRSNLAVVADERAGFGDVEVAEHGEAGGDPAGGGIGEDGNERQPGFVEAGERGGNLGELHQADSAFHHARAAGARDDDEWLARVEGQLDGASDLLAD